MTFRVVNILEVKQETLFQMSQFLLGDSKGSWLVVDEDMFPAARYENKNDAEIFAKQYEEAVNGEEPSEEALKAALEFANGLKE